MIRILIDVSYKGTAYVGWQRQDNGMSVQQMLEDALFRAFGTHITVTGASRTDAGVHALCQRAVFDTDKNVPAEKYPFLLNTLLPPDIRVTCGQTVPEDFHPRFRAVRKIYTYRIHNARHASALYGDITAHVPVPLDVRLMNEAAGLFIGTHDFAAFAASGGSAKTTVRTIFHASVSRDGDRITFTVEGNAFLYNMVRIMAGTLIYIGQGKLDKTCIIRAFDSLDRLDLGITAPAQGLELTYVGYDAGWGLIS